MLPGPARATCTCVVLPRAEQQQRVEGELVQGEPRGHGGHLPRVARVPDREEILPLVGDEAEVPAHRGMRITLPRIVLQTINWRSCTIMEKVPTRALLLGG